MSEKLFPSVPAIGSDKQDGFARILAHKLALSLPAFEADIKAATKRDTLAVFPHYYSKEEGGRIIDYLLAKCKLAGIEIASRKGNGRRGSGRRGEQGGENPPPPSGAKTLAEFSAVELNNELQSRGVRQLAGVEAELMLAELKGRGIYVGSLAKSLESAALEHLAAELERRGYPGEAMKGNPDLIGQAPELARLLHETFMAGWVPGGTLGTEIATALTNAGLFPE